MIGALRGTVLDRRLDGELLVDVNGVGYRARTTPRVIADSMLGSQVFLFTHLHVREDALVLYGFPTLEERDTFEVVLGARGVGPTLALAIMATLSPSALRAAVADDDAATLCSIPGVGKRTAASLLLDLKGKLVADDDVAASSRAGSASGATPGRHDAREALAALGYESAEIRAAFAEVDPAGELHETKVLVKAALAVLGRSR